MVTPRMKREAVFEAITAERKRQEELKASGKFAFTCADNDVEMEGSAFDENGYRRVRFGGDQLRAIDKLPILAEEFGEVARAICEGDDAALKEELLQVAAVCVAWLESLE